jgi:hypothetical protein
MGVTKFVQFLNLLTRVFKIPYTFDQGIHETPMKYDYWLLKVPKKAK